MKMTDDKMYILGGLVPKQKNNTHGTSTQKSAEKVCRTNNEALPKMSETSGEGKPFISTCINKSTLSNDEDMQNDQVILELLKDIEAMSLRMDGLSYEEHTDRVVSCFVQGGNTKEAALNIYLDWLSTEN